MDESTKPVKTLNSLIHVAEVEPFINEGSGARGQGSEGQSLHPDAQKCDTDRYA